MLKRGQVTVYQPGKAVVFDGKEVVCLSDGNTLIAGNLPDKSALYGLLMQLRDLGMTLISVTPKEQTTH